MIYEPKPFPEHIVQSVRANHDLILENKGREVLVMDIDPDELQAMNFHWAVERHNHEPDTDEYMEATLMLKTLRAMKAVAEAQANLEEALGRL